jgi:hypothetical protein
MAKRSAITVLQKKERTATFTTSVGQSLIDSLRNLEERIKAEAPDMEFNKGEVVETALREAINEANAGLDKLHKDRGARA